MLAKNLRVYAVTFLQLTNGRREKIMFKRIKQLVRMHPCGSDIFTMGSRAKVFHSPESRWAVAGIAFEQVTH